MHRTIIDLAVTALIVAVVGLAGPAQGQTTITGETKGGAFYTITVPDVWNGDLVDWGLNLPAKPVVLKVRMARPAP